MKTAHLKRHSWSPAYVSSASVAAYVIGALGFSIGIAYLTKDVVSPWWLSISIMTIVLYQMAIFWLMLQYWEPNKVFGIFTSNILCLGMIFSFFEYVLGVRLPVELPVLNIYAHINGLNLTSLSPGLVALSYAFLALSVGIIFLTVMSMVVQARAWKSLMKRSRLYKVELIIDHRLDRISNWLDAGEYNGLILPQILLVATLVIVIGLSWLI